MELLRDRSSSDSFAPVSPQPWEANTTIICILHARRPEHREMKELA